MFFQQNIKPYLTRRKMFLPLLALVFCCAFVCGGQARAEKIWDEAAIVAARAAPCKGLKPFNNIDELLYQFYINLDSDCLFNMSVAELEEVWGTKIYQIDRAQRDKEYEQYVAERPELFWGKPYNSEKDAFLVEVDSTRGWGEGRLYFNISMTQDYFEKYCTLFPEGNYPTLLPPPDVDFIPLIYYSGEHGRKPRCVSEIRGKYAPATSYTWYSSWVNPTAHQPGKEPQRFGISEAPHLICLDVMPDGSMHITAR